MKLPKSKYKGVFSYRANGKHLYWTASLTINGILKRKHSKDEREVAIWYDKVLIEEGREPVNILKRKQLKK